MIRDANTVKQQQRSIFSVILKLYVMIWTADGKC